MAALAKKYGAPTRSQRAASGQLPLMRWAYDPQGREIISAFAQVMNHLGTTFGVLKKEKCTGDPARRLPLAFGLLWNGIELHGPFRVRRRENRS